MKIKEPKEKPQGIDRHRRGVRYRYHTLPLEGT